jgi:tRNA A37 threonylcarbamoyladenosine synthetase subunit TsaC/SUA5/YrdC
VDACGAGCVARQLCEHDPLRGLAREREFLEHVVDLVIVGGNCGMEVTTVVDLADEAPLVLRVGKGDTAPFEN